MNKFKPFITTLALATSLLCSFSTWALNITASVTKTKVTKDEVIQLKIAADEKLDSDSINLDTLSNDFYVGRPSFGSSVNIMNGKRSDSSVWTVSIAPQKTGILTIPSFTVKNAATAPITLNVTVNEQMPTTEDIIEVRTKLSKKELYPNESSTLDARIIVKVDPRQLQNPNLTKPTAPGLQLQPIAEPKQYQAVLNGVDVFIIDQSFRVTASTSGDFTIQAPTLTAVVNYGNRRGNTHIVTLDGQSPQIPIKVLPIPKDYHGVWLPTSSLTLSQQWQLDNNQAVSDQSATIEAGDSITRTITLTATDLTSEQLPNLTINNPENFRVYSEKPSFADNEDGSVTMTTKQVLIAKHSGEYSLPSVQVQWWNSATKQAQTSQVDGLKVKVNQGEASSAAPLPTAPLATSSTADSSTAAPLTAATQQGDSKTGHGYWPLLTALFAILWLISSAMWWRATKQPVSSNRALTHSAQTGNLKAQLISAIKQGDAIKAQAMLEQWLKSDNIAKQDEQSIRQHLNTMNQALMGKDSVHWDNAELIKSIKNTKAFNTQQQSDLASL
ncbi:hypothetical protein A9264_09430 [Vibrio sp. UCD-FRSSP16_10]|nr:hypothetical protein A9260_09655 [Vibrio sp. UCD-FRSSP16_30]OBT22032.1 hypothetical protein A9264_09430 [Vibrio sp. UCD-FRSSP16_10]